MKQKKTIWLFFIIFAHLFSILESCDSFPEDGIIDIGTTNKGNSENDKNVSYDNGEVAETSPPRRIYPIRF